MAVSNTFSVSVNNPAVPAWFSALSHKQWTSPMSNWLGASGVIPSPLPGGATGHRSLVDAWTGMGVDQSAKKLFMLFNGGHNDYYGNEAYSCDLSIASPAWTRLRNPSTVSPTTGTITTYDDGRPATSHSTNSHAAAEGRWFMLGMPSTQYIGSARYGQWWEFDTSANDYINLGSTHATNGLSVAGLALWDSVDRQFLVLHNNNTSPSIEYQSIDNMSGSPALTCTQALNIGGSMTGDIDTTNRVLLVRGGGTGTTFCRRINTTANKQAAWTSVPITGTPPNDTCQLHWHAPSSAFLTWSSGQGLLKLTPTVSGGTYTGATWSTVTGFSGITPATHTGPGMYSKINMIRDMGDGTAAFIVLSRYANPASVSGADLCVCRLTGAV